MQTRSAFVKSLNGLVSVVVPNYNSERFIADTIASVRGQTYRNWEMVVVDDCSTDSGPAVVERFAAEDPRIRLVRLDRNNGCPAKPRNVGVRESKGDYIAFLDSDDTWHPQKLETQLGIMKRADVPFSSTGVNFFNDAGQLARMKATGYDARTAKVQTISFRKLLFKNIIPSSSVIVEKRLLDGITFNEDYRYRAVEDYHCWLKLHERIPFSCKIKLPLLSYRVSANGISKSKIDMLKKNTMLYSEYVYNGRGLGAGKYLYLLSYSCFSVLDYIDRRRRRI